MNNINLKYFTHPKMQEKIREVMGEVMTYDPICCSKFDLKWVKVVLDCSYADETCSDRTCPNRIRLPLPIDPRHPERGLLGMIDEGTMRGLYPSLFEHEAKWTCSIHTGNTSMFYDADIPELALLKALAHQWGIDVEAEDGRNNKSNERAA